MAARSLLVWLALGLCWPACAWEPGKPWGLLTLAVQLRATVASDRLLADGRFRTASEYLWRYERFDIALDQAKVVVAADATKLSFDPAKPPAGYTLCHGGHCHATDGRLVDYAEVEAGLLGAVGAGPVVLPLDVTANAALPTGIMVMAGPAELPLGTVANVQVAWRRAVVKARVWDGSPKGNRLPAAGVVVEWVLPPGSIAAQVRAQVGPHQPLGVDLRLAMDIAAGWLDAVDVAAGAPQVAELQAALLHHSTATTIVHRKD
ncbi:MAG: hypothetical protein FJ100_21990 [Deltaproteobacteria bacterium]|nr:hypothetical protein [Deltaproteobacteria bacterium]